MASARPRRYTAEQAMEFIMNYDSDENDDDVDFSPDQSEETECDSDSSVSESCVPSTSTGRGRRGRRVRGTNRRGGGGRDAPGSNSHSESQWNTGYFQPKGEEFSGTPGIQVTVNGTTPLDYFKLFFTDNILDLLVTETNRYAAQCTEAAPKPLPKYSYLALWVPVTRTDMTVFIALLINMGIVNKPEVRSYWSVDPILATSFFGTCMSRNRFEQILMFLHICNNLEQPDVNDPHRDKLFKIRPFLDMFTEACKTVYYPKRDLAVDESMMPWKGRVAFKQFIPSKPTKYGIKMYFCCEAGTGYISCLKMYSGKQGEHAEREHGENVVRYLTSDFHGKGHTIFMDSFFSSLKLFEELKQKGTDAVGTLRANRRGIPLSLKQARMKKGEAQSLHKTAPSEKKSDASLLCMKFKDKKDVFLLSTKHNGVC